MQMRALYENFNRFSGANTKPLFWRMGVGISDFIGQRFQRAALLMKNIFVAYIRWKSFTPCRLTTNDSFFNVWRQSLSLYRRFNYPWTWLHVIFCTKQDLFAKYYWKLNNLSRIKVLFVNFEQRITLQSKYSYCFWVKSLVEHSQHFKDICLYHINYKYSCMCFI